MKSLIFSNLAGDVKVEYITDLMTEGQAVFTVMQVRGLSEAERVLGFKFAQLVYDVPSFKAFAIANNLQLSISDSNADINSIKSLLVSCAVTSPAAASSGADTTPTFSGTATPGAVVTVTIAAASVTATANAAGAWTVDWTPALTPGAISASVKAVKDGVSSAAVVRAFTITA